MLLDLVLVSMLSTPSIDPRPGFALEIRATKSHLLVGEPLLLEGRATSPVRAPFHHGSLVVLVDHGSGFSAVRPRLAAAADREAGEVTATAAREFQVVAVFDVAAGGGDPAGNWVFATPGSYQVV